MKTQQDNSIRVVALTNLEAMCAHQSRVCHRYWIDKMSRSRVHVGYSNPDEYGNENPMFAVFPCYPSQWHGDADNPRVVLDYLRIINDDSAGEGWQCFEIIKNCPPLSRRGPGNNDRWHVAHQDQETRP